MDIKKNEYFTPRESTGPPSDNEIYSFRGGWATTIAAVGYHQQRFYTANQDWSRHAPETRETVCIWSHWHAFCYRSINPQAEQGNRTVFTFSRNTDGLNLCLWDIYPGKSEKNGYNNN